MDVHEVIIIQQRDQDLQGPELRAFSNICRVCLNPFKLESTNKYKNIHAEESRMTIRSLLEAYTYVKIPEYDDNLPQNLCHKCVDFLIEIHMFRSRCKINEDLLKKIRTRTLDAAKFEEVYNKKNSHDSLYPDVAKDLIDEINDQRMGIYRCKDCPSTYNTKKDLTDHRNKVKHSRLRGSECPHCGKMFNSAALVQHLRVHTKERPYACPICSAQFTANTNLKRHMKIHTEREHICEVCGKSFHRLESLTIHLKQHNPEREDEIKHENLEFNCLECNKMFATEKQLKLHTRCHRESAAFLCPDCGKIFTTKANLITHTRVHTGERPFVCEVCNKGFTQSSSLKTHQVIHSGAKSFACKFCSRKFSVKGNLQAHERLHTGKTPHRCAICQKGFCTSSTLRKHMRSHSKERNYEENEDAEVEYSTEPKTAVIYQEPDVPIEDDNDDIIMNDDDCIEVIKSEYMEQSDIIIEEYEEADDNHSAEDTEEIQVFYEDNYEVDEEIVYEVQEVTEAEDVE